MQEERYLSPLRGSLAAQYIRMSADHQKYSPENQRSVIAAYAGERQIRIVRSYEDHGRSGLSIAGRDGLKKLINDVQFGHATFDCVLVFDVSRWGRFQDVDESAYYEFICKRAGISIHYCQEEFTNDGSLASVIMKSLSRAEAADFSRKLSKRVFIAASYGVSLGFWQGAPAGFGLRRSTVDEFGNRRVDLRPGEQKHYKTDRVILVPGPRSELDIVHRIFAEFASRKKTRTEIANDLNSEGIYNSQGRPWQMQTINNILRNEKYLGQIVYNRRSYKLQTTPIHNPRDMWVRHENAFAPLVSPELFAKVQKVLAEVKYGRRRSDVQLLEQLKSLWRRKGHLSRDLIQTDTRLFSCTAYARRFGSLMNAYDRIGYDPGPRFHFYGTGEKTSAVVRWTASELMRELQRWGEQASFLPELNLLTIKGSLTIVIATAWSVADGKLDGRPHRRWHVRKIKFPRADQALIVRMQEANASIKDYFLLATRNMPFTKDGKLRVSEVKFADYRHDQLSSVLRAISEKLRQGGEVQSSRREQP